MALRERAQTGEGSATADVCRDCFSALGADPHMHDDDLSPLLGGGWQRKGMTYGPLYHAEPQGTDGWGGDVAHSDYEDDVYFCVLCGEALTGEDD